MQDTKTAYSKNSIEHRKENTGDKNKMEDTRTVFSI